MLIMHDLILASLLTLAQPISITVTCDKCKQTIAICHMISITTDSVVVSLSASCDQLVNKKRISITVVLI